MKITVIGAGKVGSSVALNCSIRELGNILLLDIIEGLPQGEAMDINHQLAERGVDCNVRGSNNYEDMRGSEFVIVVAGIGRKPGMTRMDLLKTNAEIIKGVCNNIKSLCSEFKYNSSNEPARPLDIPCNKVTSRSKSQYDGYGWNARSITF